MKGTMLVIDRTTTTFYKSGSVIEFMNRVIAGASARHQERVERMPFLKDSDRRRIEKEIKSLQVQVNHLTYKRKYRVIGITHEPAEKVRIRKDCEHSPDSAFESDVKAFYKQAHNLTLKYPYLPCLIVGCPSRPVYLPVELCEIVADQHVSKKLTLEQAARMIRAAASQKPADRFEIIKESAQSIRDDGEPYLKAFDVRINPQPLQLDGRVLRAPNLTFRTGDCTPQNGIWNVSKKHLYKVINLKYWVMINCAASCEDAEVKRFIDALRVQAAQLGFPVDEPTKNARLARYKRGFLRLIFEKAKSVCPQLQMIVFVINDDDDLYYEIKLIADVQLGIATQVSRCAHYDLASCVSRN